MNPSTTKKPKRGTQEIPVPKILSSKQAEIDKQKLKAQNTEKMTEKIQSNKNIKKSNIVFNNLIINNKNINKTETKNKEKKSNNSQTLLCKIEDEINKDDKNSKNQIKNEKTENENLFRNSLRNNNITRKISLKHKVKESDTFRNSLRNNNITRKISLKHKVKESDTLTDKDSILDDNDNSKENIKTSNNTNIKTELNSFTNSNISSEQDKPLHTSNFRKHITKIKASNSNKSNKQNIKSAKTIINDKVNDKFDDIIIPDNEIDESKKIHTNK